MSSGPKNRNLMQSESSNRRPESSNWRCTDIFNDYFQKFDRKITRSNNKNLILPPIKSQNGKKTFALNGALFIIV